MINIPSKTKLAFILFLTIIILFTRGSHFLTELSLPDASLISFLILGILSPSLILFVLFFILGSLIDFGSAIFDVSKGFYLSDGYWA